VKKARRKERKHGEYEKELKTFIEVVPMMERPGVRVW
jgi:hypothetical protein